jgi:hypothetical protein
VLFKLQKLRVVGILIRSFRLEFMARKVSGLALLDVMGTWHGQGRFYEASGTHCAVVFFNRPPV